MTQSEDALFPEDDVGDVAAVPKEGWLMMPMKKSSPRPDYLPTTW